MEENIDIKANAINKKVDGKSLKNFRDESAFRVESEDDHFFKDSKAVIKYIQGLFEIKIICEKQPSQEIFDDFDSVYVNRKIQFSKSNSLYEINGDDIKHITQTPTDPFIVTFTVSKFYSLTDNKNQFYRLQIPLESKPNFEPFQVYKLDLGGSIYYGLVKLQVKGKKYELYHFENEDLKEFYLVIDCLEQTSDVEFEESTKTILKTYSLFTGNLYLGELYFFRNKVLDDWWKYELYKFENKKENIISNVQIIHPRKFKSYLKHFKKEKYTHRIGLTVTEEKFTTICNSVHKNHKVERIINLLLEGNKTNSLILRCSTYSVALETLSNIICDKKSKETKPIQNEKLAELVLSKFKAIVEEYDFELDTTQIAVLVKKINNINKPLNADKLKLAFEISGLDLNENDIKALKARNVFLHGSTPFKKFEENEKDQINFALFSNKMHLLLTCLLLKFLGFNGAVTNHYAFGKSNRKEKVDEHFFRILKPKEGWR